MTTVVRDRGVFIVFEGIDGCGKTTQVGLLYERLAKAKMPVVCYQFPSIDPSILEVKGYLADPFARFLFYSMDRYSKTESIKKDLAAGKVILCDRYTASGLIYANAAHGIPMDWGEKTEYYIIKPDLSVFVEILNPATALDRNRKCEWKRSGPYDNLTMQTKIYHAYLEYFLAREGDGVLSIQVKDNMSATDVHEIIWNGLCNRFPHIFK